MRLLPFILMVSLLASTGGADDVAAPRSLPSTSGAARQPSGATFIPVEVFIDPHGKPLACYEVEIVATTGNVKLVGIEGGDAAAFDKAPYYDKRALLHGERVIIGAYTLSNELPTGRTRVATLMFHVGDQIKPQYKTILRVAGSSDEKAIAATVTLVAPPAVAPRRLGIRERENDRPGDFQ